ncbi:MAG: hypothetical protein AB1578_21725 [Thermodesulfobacteriota bacterium]
MRVVCSRCAAVVLETVGREPGESHGLCRACLDAAVAALRARRPLAPGAGCAPCVSAAERCGR